MSLRAAALGLWRRSNLRISEGIASGEEQVRPRNDMVRWQVREIIFLRTLRPLGLKIYSLRPLVMMRMGVPRKLYSMRI
jgi:hypothetical protein